MAYSNLYDLATDSTFLKQILVATMNQCATVLTEAASTAGHTPRAELAVAVLQNPTSFNAKFAFAVITQAGITPTTVPSTVADSAIQTAFAAIWNAEAGYFSN